MKARRWVALAAAGVAGVLVSVLVNVVGAPTASAHGAMMKPGSRTFLCWQDGLTPTGNIQPVNPACSAAVSAGGTNSLYNWFGVLRSDGGGRTRGFIPDGKLCSGGNATYSGFDIARNDYPVTHLTAGANFRWSYNMWAAHPGTFHLYVTKDSWSPTRALAWDDLESTPFHSVTNPPSSGSVGTVDGQYYWNANLPAGKSGRHIIYSVWTRSDSQETFYNCSDVVFDGGNGEVTGVGRGGNTTTTTTSTTTSTSTSTTTSTTTTTSTSNQPGDPNCMAIYKITSSWSGGFQGEVEVMNHSTSAYNGWTARWTYANGQTVNSVWNGVRSGSGAEVVVKNVDWNRTVAPESSVKFGFTASYSGTNSLPTVTCTSP
ncbi:lytic polysaccharide monooxygenase auxiliary activity family 9 protein [Saccharothrix syringae]|uniref:lytic polysaccharide monooxygenase auxiliary activity family 9 protein n=1 Tax=Saccharothrix syringae TaxID=103733 RepID=UPI00068C51FA|nr:lytic polysaccharide monooxygenase [Saccharothrix syringae]